MKTSSNVFKKTGNISMVQIETLEGDGMPFIPAASAVDTGDPTHPGFRLSYKGHLTHMAGF